MTLAAMMNQFNWSQDKPLREWIRNNRLDGFTKLTSGVNPDEKEKMDILMRMRDTAPKAVGNLMKLAEQSPHLPKADANHLRRLSTFGISGN